MGFVVGAGFLKKISFIIEAGLLGGVNILEKNREKSF